MREPLLLLTAVLSAGCSVLFNPDNIHPGDGPASDGAHDDAQLQDSQVIGPADPMMITVASAYPLLVDEGTGAHGSRPAIVALHGDNFIKETANLAVTFTPISAATLIDLKVSSDHKNIVLALQIPVDTTCAPPTLIPMTVTVTEDDGSGGTAMTQLANAFSIHCLNELTANVETAALEAKYSTVELAAAITFTPQASATKAAIIRSASHIVIAGAVTASAAGASPGPGGGLGGADDAAGSGPGRGQRGLGGVTGGGGGGGAGFVVAGTAGAGDGAGDGLGGIATGDRWISSYPPNQPSGGGGGQSFMTAGGLGGAGGGTLELTASGDITVSAITASGGNPTAGTVISGAGGAGAGGVILLRSGGAITPGALTVATGATIGNGGASSPGRIRIDVATGTVPAGATIGPMFSSALVVATAYPTVTLRGTPGDHSSSLLVLDRNGNVVDNGHLYQPFFDASGTAQVTPVLKVGFDRICVLVAGNVDPTVAEGTNCIDLGYAP
ncbi:hypothetical protein BH11MYX1_BH11MYX1_21530 [soil metagenome]